MIVSADFGVIKYAGLRLEYKGPKPVIHPQDIRWISEILKERILPPPRTDDKRIPNGWKKDSIRTNLFKAKIIQIIRFLSSGKIFLKK